QGRDRRCLAIEPNAVVDRAVFAAPVGLFSRSKAIPLFCIICLWSDGQQQSGVARHGVGLQLLVMITNREIGRDLFFADSVLFIGSWAANQMGCLTWPGGCQVTAGSMPDVRFLIAIASIALCAGLVILTRRLLAEW